MQKNLKNCNQFKCIFLKIGIGCKACQNCNASPFLIDDNCDVCWNCSHDLGILRWADKNQKQEPEQAEKEKPIEVKC